MENKQQDPPPPQYGHGYGPSPPPYNANDPPPEQPYYAEAPSQSAVLLQTGQANDPEASAPQFNMASLSDKAIRRSFIRKVYLILTCQILFTIAVICLFIFVDPVKRWVQAHSWIYYISYGVFLVTYIILCCCRDVRRKFPVNFICLGIFTMSFTYMAAMISCYYDIPSVLIALGITALVCIGVTIFSIQTKIDFTMCSGLLFCGCLALFLFGICLSFMWCFYPDNTTRGIMYAVYGGLGALLFSLFLAYDTQVLVGGKKYELSPEEYIFGALNLYIDFVYIFMFILTMVGSRN